MTTRHATYRLSRKAERPQPGFSLAELMIAIGILGIGMTMAATLFPAAIKLNEMSTKETIGTAITENGLAMAKALLKPSDFPDPAVEPDLMVLADSATLTLDPNRQHYPDGDPNSRRGFVVLGRRREFGGVPGSSTYQLVIVSYDSRVRGGLVTAKEVEIKRITRPGGGVTRVQLADPNTGDPVHPVRSPVIVAKNGSYARIIDISLDGSDEWAVLDHDIDPIDPNDVAVGDTAFVIVESGAAESPAMTVLVAETALRP